jgi:hypothetical protein
MSFVHTTVLLNETVEAALTDPNGTYVDGTFGRGGHSRLLLSRLGPQGRLIAFDKDPEAVAAATEGEHAIRDPRFAIHHCSFARMGEVLPAAPSPGCCWTWASVRPRSTTQLAASASVSTGRWTCAWTPRGARAPPSSWRGPTSVTSHR